MHEERCDPATSRLARRALGRALTALAISPSVHVTRGSRAGHFIRLAEASEWVLGRDPKADFVLSDDRVSRRHALIRRDWSGTYVKDLGSLNGIAVNGRRIIWRRLAHGDEVVLGATRFRFVDPSQCADVRPAPSTRLPALTKAPVEKATPSSLPEPAATPAPEPEPLVSPARQVPPGPINERLRRIALASTALCSAGALVVIVAVLVGA
jgi:pSer/pThr/pTyr-binding forkhead associated (FHA) protein